MIRFIKVPELWLHTSSIYLHFWVFYEASLAFWIISLNLSSRLETFLFISRPWRRCGYSTSMIIWESMGSCICTYGISPMRFLSLFSMFGCSSSDKMVSILHSNRDEESSLEIWMFLQLLMYYLKSSSWFSLVLKYKASFLSFSFSFFNFSISSYIS